jgi:hypothetical protein
MKLSIEVTNMVGQTVYFKDIGRVNNHQYAFVIDVADFRPGVYFYTVTANEESVTRKMIVE